MSRTGAGRSGGALQSTLFAGEQAALGSLVGLRRVPLSQGAWIDVLPGWLSGAEEVLSRLHAQVGWHAERRQMFDRQVDVPRLTKFYEAAEPLPHPVLAEAREALSSHYAGELGEPFRTAGLCLYRDGQDSVAWHGDRIGRGRTAETMVAILSVGSARHLALRPRGGGPSQRFALGHGDLVVMGGTCQRTWDHAIPKTSRDVGPRISIQFRPAGVR